jgi:hypothetical protein
MYILLWYKKAVDIKPWFKESSVVCRLSDCIFIVTRVCLWAGFGLVNGFIDHLHTQLGTACNYSAIANLHNSQITTAPSEPFIACFVFTSRSLAAASSSGDSSQPPVQNSTDNWLCRRSCLQDNSSARTTQKTQPLYCCRGVFTAPLHSNGRGADHIENIPF